MDAYAYVVEFKDDRPKKYGLISCCNFAETMLKIVCEYDERDICNINIKQLMEDQSVFYIPKECFQEVCDANTCF